MSAGFIHLFSTAHGTEATRLQAALLKKGLGLRLYESVDALCMVLTGPQRPGEPQLVMLADTQSANCQAARSLRKVAPQVGVMALLPKVETSALHEAMHSGIDICWPQGAPVQLVSAAVLRLMNRSEAVPRPRVDTLATSAASWALASGGWVVETPQGASITLTTAERALMLALCGAPGRRLGHAQLMRAVEDSFHDEGRAVSGQGQGGYARSAARRLSVLVSRLRNKFAAAGIELPLRSLRRQGYEISVEFAGQTEAWSQQASVEMHSHPPGPASSARRRGFQTVAAEPVLAASAVDP